MTKKRDWRRYRDMWVRILEQRTGEGVHEWLQRIDEAHLSDQRSLRAWLAKRGVTGYAQALLVMERFGYPDFFRATADELINGQYADRMKLKRIYTAVIKAATRIGNVTLQARKTYVSLLTARRTFARVQPSTKTRVDLGLRLDGQAPGGRLRPSRIDDTMRLRISLTSPKDVDDEVLSWLHRAYNENC
jgi:hypothetical protein